MKYNIFGTVDETILKAIAQELGYESHNPPWFTEDIYFSSFFYLTKRFGPCEVWDEYKDAGLWNFKVKQYTIQVYLNSNWTLFAIFGNAKFKIKNGFVNPYWMRCERVARKNPDYVDIYKDMDKRTDAEIDAAGRLLEEFMKENNIDHLSLEKANEFWDYAEAHNRKLAGYSYEKFTEMHGAKYINSDIRHALRTLRQFLKNMLTPISVRDVLYNIKGQCGNEYDIYVDNIKIERI